MLRGSARNFGRDFDYSRELDRIAYRICQCGQVAKGFDCDWRRKRDLPRAELEDERVAAVQDAPPSPEAM